MGHEAYSCDIQEPSGGHPEWHVFGDAAKFFMSFINSNVPKIAVENPVGYMSTYYRKPDCIIQPYEFGHHARKKTCLWLKGLPVLRPTNIVDAGEIMPGGYSVGANADCARDETGKKFCGGTIHERLEQGAKLFQALPRPWPNSGEV